MHAKSTKMHPKSTKNRNKIEKDRPKNAKWFKMPKSSPKKCPSTAPCRREAPAQEADPLRQNLPGWGFGHILLKNNHPVQAESKF